MNKATIECKEKTKMKVNPSEKLIMIVFIYFKIQEAFRIIKKCRTT